MATNSYQGISGLTGVSGLLGSNSYGGSNSLSGSNTFTADPNSRNIQASQIQDTGLRSLLSSNNQFKPVNSYSKMGVTNIGDINNMLSNYSTADLSPFSNFSSVQDLKPSGTVGGKDVYSRQALQDLQNAKNYWSQPIDPTVAKIMGDKYGTDERGAYTKGFIDPTQFGVGDSGYQHQDIGNGKYNIMGANGEVLGTGYKSVQDTLNDYEKNRSSAAANAMRNDPSWMSQYDQSMNSVWYDAASDMWREGRDPNKGPTTDADLLAYQGYTPSYTQGAGGAASDWEALGQLLTNGSIADRQQWGSLPINSANESISGANTLYGSTPIFYGGKLIGYKSDLGMGTPTSSNTSGEYTTSENPFGYSQTHIGSSHDWSTGLSRQLDPNSYSGLIQSLGGTEYFAPTENVSKLPGWTNVEGYSHQDKQYGGLMHEIFKGLDPILDKLDPMHNQVQKWTTGESTTEGQSPYFQKIAPMIVSAFLPAAGAALSAGDAASRGDNKGLLSAIAGYGLNGVLNGVDFGAGNLGNAAISGAVKGGVQGGIQGGNLKSALTGALMGGAGSGLNSYLSSVNASPFNSAIARGGLGALGASLQGRKAKDALMSGLVSGGLGLAGGAASQYVNPMVSNIGSTILQQALARKRKKAS